MKVMKAREGKVLAYRNEKGEEVILGSELYLGINDDGFRYYEVDKPEEVDDADRYSDTN